MHISTYGIVLTFRDLSRYFARLENSPEVKPRHRAQAFFAITDFAVLLVYGVFLSADWLDFPECDEHYIIRAILIILLSSGAAFLPVYLLSRIRNLVPHCLVGVALLSSFAWIFFIRPYLN